jgi:hypothetical protein
MTRQFDLGSRPYSQRPTRDFLLQLPRLHVNSDHEIDYAASDPELLLQIASHAEVVQRTLQLGISAVGHLTARAAPEIELSEIPGDFVESLGWMLAELGDVLCIMQSLATACRRYTADYRTPKSRRIPNVIP